ncbi:MAG: hypothetical protein J6Q82_00195 [Clostridia bacterium]|nr:hypothetical protein [Clostridia bacterium]
MKYSEQYQIRWHDTDATLKIRPTQLLALMQETSNRHIATSGMSLDKLRDQKKLGFILSKTRVEIARRPSANEEITVETWTNPSRSFGFNRSFLVRVKEEVVAKADTLWALVGVEDRQFHKMEETGYVFEDEPALELSMPPRLKIPNDLCLEELGTRRIVYSDIDYNMHMNNTRYADMLCDFLPLDETELLRGFSLSYLHEAAYGHRITVLSGKQNDSRFFRTIDEDGTVCLEAQLFLQKKE